MSDRVWGYIFTVVAALLLIAIPGGIGLAVYFDNPTWLWFTLVGLIIFMAG